MSLPGLPPLPKSLSGLELNGGHTNNNTGIMPIDIQRVTTAPSAERKPSTLDTQLAILRREMVNNFLFFLLCIVFTSFVGQHFCLYGMVIHLLLKYCTYSYIVSYPYI